MPRATRARGKSPASANGGMRFRNVDFTDREILIKVHESIDADGWATTTDIALAFGYTGASAKNATPATKIASRLAWMRDGGLLESTGPDYSVMASVPGARDTRWCLTETGDQIRTGKLSRAVDNAILGMGAGEQILMMRKLTQEGFVRGDLAVAFAIRREYSHNIAQRKLYIRGSHRGTA